MTYEFDVFLSYPRKGNAGDWVRNHFHPALEKALQDFMPHDPRIFFDAEMPVGAEWPSSVKDALLRSKLLVAVWTPPYFRSKWCLAEWRSMRNREELLGISKVNAPGLVYPVVYSDGDHFHELAKKTQWRKELSQYGYPWLSFRDTVLYLEFHDHVAEIAQQISSILDTVPDWANNWPVIMPEDVVDSDIKLPQL